MLFALYVGDAAPGIFLSAGPRLTLAQRLLIFKEKLVLALMHMFTDPTASLLTTKHLRMLRVLVAHTSVHFDR